MDAETPAPRAAASRSGRETVADLRARLRRSEMLIKLTQRVAAIDNLDELLATLVEDLRNRIPLRQFEIFERVKLKHQSPMFVAEDLGMTRAMVDRNIHKAMTALRDLASHAEYQQEFYQ